MSAQSRIASVAISVHSVVENVTQSHIILISVASTQPVANPRSFFSKSAIAEDGLVA